MPLSLLQNQGKCNSQRKHFQNFSEGHAPEPQRAKGTLEVGLHPKYCLLLLDSRLLKTLATSLLSFFSVFNFSMPFKVVIIVYRRHKYIYIVNPCQSSF